MKKKFSNKNFASFLNKTLIFLNRFFKKAYPFMRNFLNRIDIKSEVFLIIFLIAIINFCFVYFGLIPTFIITSILGTSFALRRRSRLRIDEYDSGIQIILNDYKMSKSASLSLISLTFTLIQGLTLSMFFSGISIISGLSLYTLFGGKKCLLGYCYGYGSMNILSFILIYILIPPIILLFSRLFLEVLTTAFRIAQDISKISDDFANSLSDLKD